jgi:hypothetical protein
MVWQSAWRRHGTSIAYLKMYNRVFKRIPIVLQPIVDCGVDNINVEQRRGHHGAAVVAAPLSE